MEAGLRCMSGCDTVLAVNDDGLLIVSLASLKSVSAKDDDRGGPIDPENTGVDFKGQKRSNATHQSVILTPSSTSPATR